jgi:hypothetical protein
MNNSFSFGFGSRWHGRTMEHAMTTLIELLRTKFRRGHRTPIDDYLLCDIGLSRIVLEYQGN